MSNETRPRVRDVMHAPVITCPPEATLRTVAGLLAEHRIHAVVVASNGEEAAVAVVTDRDVVWSGSHGGLDNVSARDAASEPTVTVRAEADLGRAAELMAHFGTSHVVVTEDGGGRPVGILSSLDVAAAVARPAQP
jgi:CBS domain-containing protein